MDAVRLLSSSNAPRSDFAVPDSRKAVVNMFTSQLSFLLFNPIATDYSASPPDAKAGAHYDAKVAALAAFIDDARLFVRVANRARLRLSPATRIEGLLHPSREIREVHYRLIQARRFCFSLLVGVLGYSDLLLASPRESRAHGLSRTTSRPTPRAKACTTRSSTARIHRSTSSVCDAAAPLQLLLLSKRSPSHFAGFLVLAL